MRWKIFAFTTHGLWKRYHSRLIRQVRVNLLADVVTPSLQHIQHYCLHPDDYGCLLTMIFQHPPEHNKFSISQYMTILSQ